MKQPSRLQRLVDWEDARYSFVPPSAALDVRCTVAHLRILILLGRVNTKHGWCEAAQSEIAKLTGLKRGTVNEALADLVRWDFVEMRTREETGATLCHYRVKIDREGVSAITDTPGGGVSAITDRGIGHNRQGYRPQKTPPIKKLARALDHKITRSKAKNISDLKSEVKAIEHRSASPLTFKPPRRANYVAVSGTEQFDAWVSFFDSIDRDDIAAEARLNKRIPVETEWPPNREAAE